MFDCLFGYATKAKSCSLAEVSIGVTEVVFEILGKNTVGGLLSSLEAFKFPSPVC